MSTPDARMDIRARVQWAGLLGGPALAAIAFVLLPAEYANEAGEMVPFSVAGRATLAMMVWMGVWWLTEAIDISATALLPLAAFPILGVATIKAAAAPYAHELIFLFMGGFLLALSMQRWGLDKRIALLTVRLVGTKPVNMIAGFMLATAVMSAFVSNTATTAMMLPIAVSVIDLVLREKTGATLSETGRIPEAEGRNFALCLMLGIAYAASIGGVATIIGTPPNTILVAYIRDNLPGESPISFARWMLVGVPLSVAFLPLVWLLLTRVLYPVHIGRIEGGRELIDREYQSLGPPKRGEIVTFIVFSITAALWIIRPILADGWAGEMNPETGEVVSWVIPPLIPGLTDAGIAMAAGMALFVIPVSPRSRTFAMNWDTARRLPWGILILFGGGLSLAAAVTANGVAEFIANQVPTLEFLGDVAWLRTLLLVLIVAAAVIFLTELTSNTATTAALVPILAPLGVALGLHPYMLIFPAAIAASCAFMMPVATPPNAIVFGSGYITIPQMIRAGFWLNILGVLLVTALAVWLMPAVLIDG